MIWIKKQTINPEVTDYYLKIIGDAYLKKGENVQYFYNWNEYKPNKNDITVVTRYKEVLKMIFSKRSFVYWIQGLLPEENYAQKHSKARLLVYEKIEKFMIKKTHKHGFFIMVSEYMKKHYEKKYNIRIDNCYIMPCNNDIIHENSFDVPGKYDNDVFCYAGGLSVWQCIDQTLILYKKIEEQKQNTKLLLLVPDKDKALDLVKKYNIKNFEIDYVSVDQLPQRLSQAKYGFIIREDIELNRVSTPTKLMTYAGNGLIPILSSCLYGLLENVSESKYVIKLESNDDIHTILDFMNKKINPSEIKTDLESIYLNHYSQETHIDRLSIVLPTRI